MGHTQSKNRKKGPIQSTTGGVHLYPNLSNEMCGLSNPNMVDFHGPPSSEACFGNTIPNFQNHMSYQSTAGVHPLYPNLANEYSTFGQPNTVEFRSTPGAVFGNIMPNCHEVQSFYCNPAPSAPPETLLGADLTAIVQSMINQEVEMQTREPESCENQQNTRRKKNRNKKRNNDINPEKKPCPNAGDGCKLHFNPEQMNLHVKECLFMDIVCPLDGVFGRCGWRDKVKSIKQHFVIKHPSNIGLVNELIFLDSPRIVHLVDLEPFKFLVQIKVDEKRGKILVAVQHYSTQVCASKWTYEFEFRGPMMPNIKVGDKNCITAGASIEKTFNTLQCGVLTMTPCVKNAFKNGALRFKYRIMKVALLNKNKQQV